MGPREGMEWGAYRLLKYLGGGNFGSVWKAERRQKDSGTTEALFALKVPHMYRIDHTMISKEAASWKRASGHPNIVTYFEKEIIQSQGEEYPTLSVQYCNGGTIDQVVKNRAESGQPLSINEIIHLMDRVLEAVAYLHSLPAEEPGNTTEVMIHRDLKPHNILLHNGVPKVADFGLARLAINGFAPTQLAGTWAYSPPDSETRSQWDVWSLGVIYFELLMGHLPFQDLGEKEFAIPRPLRNDIPSGIREAILRAISKDQGVRILTIREFQEQTGVSARIAYCRSQRDRLIEMIRRHRGSGMEAKQIAFSPSGGWTILFAMKNFTYSDIHHSLVEKLNEYHRQSHEIKQVFFFPDGEWGILVGSHGFWKSGTKDEVCDELVRLSDQRKQIVQVTFATDGEWVILCEDVARWSMGIPDDLIELLRGQEYRRIRQVAIAPNGGWVALIGKNNFTVSATQPIPDSLDARLWECRNTRQEIKQLVFFMDGTWCLLAENNQLWAS